MKAFARYVGIDYSGAQTPGDSLAGLRIFEVEDDVESALLALAARHADASMFRRALAEIEHPASQVTRRAAVYVLSSLSDPLMARTALESTCLAVS